MKILLVTEKCKPHSLQRDGGARLVETIRQAFGNDLSIMQFGPQVDSGALWHFDYPFNFEDRFERRVANANFIAQKVKAVEHQFTHIIFVHVSMQFGFIDLPLSHNIKAWTLPMFLSQSYIFSKENVPENYQHIERLTLANSENILTPSHLEKRQLIDFYSVPKDKIHVIPRGVDRRIFKPKVRSLSNSPPQFCSINSIKLQKNILGLVRLFAKLQDRYPNATLKIIGPIQDYGYYNEICAEIELLGLANLIEFTGHLSPEKLAATVENTHLHLSTSSCETFGRSIFETLALGLPNISRASNNAAAEFLSHLPYTNFVDDDEQALSAIDQMLAHLPKLSTMASEIGSLYDDELLSKLLVAKIHAKDCMAVSDFDGTLFHKNDYAATKHCMNVFKQFPLKVVCSARSLEDILAQLKLYNLAVDWIIAYSGAVVANGDGEIIWLTPLEKQDVRYLESVIPYAQFIKSNNGQILQIMTHAKFLPSILGMNIEIYQEKAFISHWEASKLRAVIRLINYINWPGQVQAFGDGIYDNELLNYFDGELITPSNYATSYQKRS